MTGPIAIVLDTETTGVEPEDQIIEFAWREYAIGIPGAARFEQRYKPTRPIALGALATHHILPSELESCPPHTEVALPPATKYIIGHNVDFDWKMLGSPPVQRICTLALSRKLFPELSSHSLSAMCYHVGGAEASTRKHLQNAHSAYADVLNCYWLLTKLVSKAAILQPISTLHDLWCVSENARIPTRMAFGKHKGKPISQVDRGWVMWYTKQEDTDPYLMQAFEIAGLLPKPRR